MGDEQVARQITEAGAGVGETFWHMPMPAELRSLLDSDIADLAERPARRSRSAGCSSPPIS